MSLQCPRCNALKIVSLLPTTQIGAAVRAVGGAARGASAALTGTKPILGIALGALSDAILGCIEGCATGTSLSEQLNRHLANNRCQVCGHRFNLPT
ncbi:hypothetical protein [Pseudomonas aeruginosa]|uniref:hypothetical protein n=1 Tax=Pseudomonas aeruginosa TaxID=287 RepID=UPI001CC809B4|nr:hypothetical protein [Pseudomonas aeruginosa]MBZ5239760.1 hypothetical protein [Pseudomonas aeruginosa]MBZ5253138.1 hypothetical protein [Pseudomonas aeruginosa]